ncbi:MAG TPA: ABC transporter permease [Actinophytocola sp.]|uniref:ABC transporter permease n=1 Tax=Actinophytocola sp. TaxID=1872138 RepID=UPI002DDD92CC|nr:ABC transporter permease [Actinophytocola sp.]HEV2781927.1 ABC transporter permease [Actinophytocola sp.]
MLKFVVRRSALAVLAIVVVMFVLHIGVFYLGDPFASEDEKVVPPKVRDALRAKFGLDEPFHVRFLIYLKNLFTGDLGIDFDQRRPVADMLAATVPNSLLLAVLAIAISTVIGVVAGVVAAVWRDSFIDTLITTGAVVLMCIPLFVLATALRRQLTGLELFGTEIFPSLPRRFGEDVPRYKEVLLPAISLAAADLVFVARLMRTSMLEVLGADYLRTARAKGISERRVLFKHGVRNAIIPVVNHMGIAVGILMGGTVIVETIFQYNGVGFLFLRAILANNRPIIMGVTAYAAIVFIVVIALVDMLSAYLDPRIRLN